jgi:hypothetical protein
MICLRVLEQTRVSDRQGDTGNSVGPKLKTDNARSLEELLRNKKTRYEGSLGGSYDCDATKVGQRHLMFSVGEEIQSMAEHGRTSKVEGCILERRFRLSACIGPSEPAGDIRSVVLTTAQRFGSQAACETVWNERLQFLNIAMDLLGRCKGVLPHSPFHWLQIVCHRRARRAQSAVGTVARHPSLVGATGN